MKEKIKKIIYLTYDGLTDPLGQSQIIPYLSRLSNEMLKIDIISFEKKETFLKTKSFIDDKLSNKNIDWHPLKYTKKPAIISTVFDIYIAYKLVKKLQINNNYDIIHCRGYIAAIIGHKLKMKYNNSLIFDMRGWFPDEKLESGAWKGLAYIPIYRYFKKIEKTLFIKSDKIISLTHVGKFEILKKKWSTEKKIGVIPTCVDFINFPKFEKKTKDLVRNKLKLDKDCKILIYSGSIGGNYDFKEFSDVFEVFLKRSNKNRIIILTKTPLDYLYNKIHEHKLDKEKIIIVDSPFNEVYKYLQASDIGLIIYKRTFSTIGRSPTKLGEYWACGLPVLSLKRIGDLDLIISKYPHGGQLVNKLDDKELNDSFDILEKYNSKEKIRISAKEYYDIKKGVEFYSNIYNELDKK